MAAKFLNNVRVLAKDGSEDDYLKAVEAWATPDGMSDRYFVKLENAAIALLDYGRVKKSSSPLALS